MKKTIALSIGLVAVAILIRVQFTARNGAEFSAAAQPEVVASVESNDPPAPLLPARAVSRVPLSPVEVRQPEKMVFQRIADNDTNVLKLSSGQIQAFLARNKTNADSLLTAFNATHDQEFLREAARRYPSNALVLASVLGYDVFPGQRRELIEQFKQVSPENPLANYLSAREYTKNQQPELALREFIEASGKNGFHDFSVERLQGMEELYLASGYSAAEAKALAMANLEFPALGKLRDVGRDMAAVERQYAAAGDTASAQALAKLGLGLAGNTLNAGVNSLMSFSFSLTRCCSIASSAVSALSAGAAPDITDHACAIASMRHSSPALVPSGVPSS